MSHTEFTTTTNEFIGTAAGHTIGMVIPNIDPEVRTLLKIPEQYSSLGIAFVVAWHVALLLAFLLQEPVPPHRLFQ